MGLACSTEFEGDYDSDTWMWLCDFDLFEYKEKRGRKCRSCREVMVREGDECIAFDRIRAPRTEIEELIHGGEVCLAPWFYCERCANQAISLNALGFTWELGWDKTQLLVEQYKVEYQGVDDPCGGGKQ